MTMAADTGQRGLARRVWMCGIGALAGLAGWLLIDVLPDRLDSDRVLLFLSAATGGFFTALLAAAGALSPARALAAAAAAGLPAAVLLTWASFRHRSVETFLEGVHAPLAFALIVALSLPFLIVGLRSGGSWRDYPALFHQAWDIVVRFAAALIFVGVFWGVVFLSDALFGLVGLEVIERLIEIDPVPSVLTGAVAGLALAVVAELADYVSPFLILRLLRLFLPVVLVVTAVFLVALPFRGLSDLFGGLSAAGVLLAMSVGIATLITSAVERDDTEAVQSPAMRLAVQGLSLTVPVLTALALYAVLLRVSDYGWSPDRVAAACAASVGLGYGVLYSVGVLRRRGWMTWIRQANTAMALAVIGVAAMWLTPILNAERLSARDQLARFQSGQTSVEELDLWFLARDLGVAGERALARLSALDHPGREALADRLARLEASGSRYEFETADRDVDADALRAEIARLVPVRPAGRSVEAATFGAVAPAQVESWAEACRTTTPLGNPGCMVILADLLPERDGDEVLFLWGTGARTDAVVLRENGVQPPRYLSSGNGSLAGLGIDDLLTLEPEVRPLPLNAVMLGEATLFVLP